MSSRLEVVLMLYIKIYINNMMELGTEKPILNIMKNVLTGRYIRLWNSFPQGSHHLRAFSSISKFPNSMKIHIQLFMSKWQIKQER